jgi:hypothetical protein
VRRLAVPHEPRDVAHRDRGLLDQQLRGDAQPAGEQILAEAHFPELRVRSRDLARGARERPRHPLQRQRLAVVAGDGEARAQVQLTPLLGRRGTHI